MKNNIKKLKHQATYKVDHAKNIDDLKEIKTLFLGRNGYIRNLTKNLASITNSDEKFSIGKLINKIKQYVEEIIKKKTVYFKNKILNSTLLSESIDVTLPGRQINYGSLHPITQIKNLISNYFYSLGFVYIEGPEIENEFYNFEALNMSKYHPARDTHDTFYICDSNKLLRTHTSPVQIRALEKYKPPLKFITQGKVYRKDSDINHTPMFHQLECLIIDKDITLIRLKQLLSDFFLYLFQKKNNFRFRPSYFPFTEPSAEVDIICLQCSGNGCNLCKFTGWIEIVGCGMIHPKILKNANISTSKYQGLAFGIGIDRLTMLYFNIDDLRIIFENNLSFLRQF